MLSAPTAAAESVVFSVRGVDVFRLCAETQFCRLPPCPAFCSAPSFSNGVDGLFATAAFSVKRRRSLRSVDGLVSKNELTAAATSPQKKLSHITQNML